MEGVGRAARRQVERDVALAWDIERMARQKRLRPLRHYMRELDSAGRQSLPELMAGFRQMKKRGLPINITRVKR